MKLYKNSVMTKEDYKSVKNSKKAKKRGRSKK